MTLLLEYLYKGHWDKRHGSVSVLTFKSAFFLERQWEQLELQAKWGKHWTSLSPIFNSAAAGRFIPPDYTPKQNDRYCISSVERVVVEVKNAIETNMELSKDKQVQVMDGGDKLH